MLFAYIQFGLSLEFIEQLIVNFISDKWISFIGLAAEALRI